MPLCMFTLVHIRHKRDSHSGCGQQRIVSGLERWNMLGVGDDLHGLDGSSPNRYRELRYTYGTDSDGTDRRADRIDDTHIHLVGWL